MGSVVAFGFLTFVLTWGWWGLVSHALGRGGELWLLPGTIAPSLVALWLTARSGGKTGVKALLAPVFQAPARVGWYLFAIGYVAVVKLIVALLYRLVAGGWPRLGDEAWYLLLGALVISTPVQVGEELGWRGYLLPRLAQRYGLSRAGLVTGVIWAGWHLPLFFAPGGDLSGQSFPLFLVQVTAISVTMAWVYGNTGGSLLLMMLMHSAINQASFIVPAGATVAQPAVFLGGSLVGWLSALLLWTGAAFFLTRMPAGRSAVPQEPLR